MKRPARFSLLVLALTTLFCIASVVPVQAAIRKSQTIGNGLSEFIQGAFQRTSLSARQATVGGSKITDQPGAVQLGPIGLIKDWQQTGYALPYPVYRHGTVSIGSRVFVIGGLARIGSATTSNPTANVLSIGVSLQTGLMQDPGWETEPSLPAVQHSRTPGRETAIAEVSAPAVTSVANGNSGYIYVMGGRVQFGTVGLSSYATRVATVTNGRITGWQSAAPLPDFSDPTRPGLGVEEAQAASVTINGQSYVYVIGGVQTSQQGTGGNINIVQAGQRTVFYARVGGDGLLYKPSNGAAGWDTADSIPLDPGDVPTGAEGAAGIYGGVATIDYYPASTQDSDYALYLMGGQINPANGGTPAGYNSRAYIATIAANGAISWIDNSDTLPEARVGMAGNPFRGNFYLTGGRPTNGTQPDRSVLTSYAEDDLGLADFGGVGSDLNFLKSEALPSPRMYHGQTIITAGPDANNQQRNGFVYLTGGIGATDDGDTSDDVGTTSVLFGRIGGSEDIEESGYAPSGWYYSRPYQIPFATADIQELNWTTEITSTATDIAIEYRISLDADCNNATWNDNSWRTVDGDTGSAKNSLNGANTALLTQEPARCFQYRSLLATLDDQATPRLLNFGIVIVVPGSPDLRFSKSQAVYGTGGALESLEIELLNRNDDPTPPNNVTQAADAATPGSFFVELYVYGPGQPVQVPPMPPASGMPASKLCMNIDNSFMQPNTVLPLTNWYISDPVNDGSCNKTAVPYDQLTKTLFPTAGQYTIVVAADTACYTTSYGCVDERDARSQAGQTVGELNNVAQFTVTIPDAGGGKPLLGAPKRYLPIIFR